MTRTSVPCERKDSERSYSLQNMQYTHRNACVSVYTFLFLGIRKSQNDAAPDVNIDNIQTTGRFLELGKKRAKQNAQTSSKAAVS